MSRPQPTCLLKLVLSYQILFSFSTDKDRREFDRNDPDKSEFTIVLSFFLLSQSLDKKNKKNKKNF